MPRFLFVVIVLFLCSCDGFHFNPKKRKQLKDAREQERLAQFHEDSSDCVGWRATISRLRASLPEDPRDVPALKDSLFGIPAEDADFPLFTYAYFMHPDSAGNTTLVDQTRLPLCYPLSANDDVAASGERHTWERILASGYVFILYPEEIVQPVIKSEKSFESGRVRGTVLVYKLVSGEILGSFPVDVKNSRLVQTLIINNMTAGGLEDDLGDNVVAAIRERKK